MGKGGKVAGNQEKSKRNRSDDELSPTLIKDQKHQKMSVSEKDFKELSDNVAAMMKMMKRLELLDSIKASQDELCSSFKAIEKRVESLEKKYDEMREEQESEVVCEKLRAIEKKNHALEQALLNDRLIVRNLPIDLVSNVEMLDNVLRNLFNALKISISDSQVEATAMKAPDKKSANIALKLSSAMLKTRIVKQFRAMKKQITEDCPLLVDKLVTLSSDHHLNGRLVMISNRLTPYNTKLIQNARKLVPSHFDFAYDTPESLIMVRIGDKFYKIESDGDIQSLVDEVEKNREKKKTGNKTRSTPTMTTRLSNKNNGG